MPVMVRETKMSIEAREVKKYPYIAFCDQAKCFFIVSARDEVEGVKSLEAHNCPHGGSPDRIPGKPLLSAMWRELDACMDGIMLARSVVDAADFVDISSENSFIKDQQYRLEYHKSRAGGIATCLFICLGGAPGYYESQDDITREAVRRYKMRLGELEWEPTQGDNYDALRDGATPRWASVVATLRERGIASRESIDPPPNRSSAPVPRPRKATTRTRPAAPEALRVPPPMPATPGTSAPVIPTVPVAPPVVQYESTTSLTANLPQDVVAGVQNGLKSGLFDHQTLADMYGIPVSIVAALDS